MGELKRLVVKLDGGRGAPLSSIETGNILPQTLVSRYETNSKSKGGP